MHGSTLVVWDWFHRGLLGTLCEDSSLAQNHAEFAIVSPDHCGTQGRPDDHARPLGLGNADPRRVAMGSTTALGTHHLEHRHEWVPDQIGRQMPDESHRTSPLFSGALLCLKHGLLAVCSLPVLHYEKHDLGATDHAIVADVVHNVVVGLVLGGRHQPVGRHVDHCQYDGYFSSPVVGHSHSGHCVGRRECVLFRQGVSRVYCEHECHLFHLFTENVCPALQ
mmetsp:Transcript_38189/g.41396  ORF Transcript_38189/g.41396 Transcript_38189/m.41396 type:complete len:222 (-) Transcript_38189:660-1325(-)